MKGNIRLYVGRQHIEDARILNQQNKRNRNITPIHLAIAEQLAKDTEDFGVQFNNSKIIVRTKRGTTSAKRTPFLETWLYNYQHNEAEPAKFRLQFESV